MTEISDDDAYAQMMEHARWNQQGDSVNMAGAAADAWEWLRLVRPLTAENALRLRLCKRALAHRAAQAS